MYNHLFGPVRSRRLGLSLGIDLVPYKVCSFDCIYCECGKTTLQTIQRKAYVSIAEVFHEIQDYLDSSPLPDFMTFSGSGEPTLHDQIGEVIAFIKEKAPGVNVAVLTNSSFLDDPDVRKSLLKADVVMPSLDAVSETVFRRINRPHPDVSVARIISGLIEFRQEYAGQIWLEVFIVPGLNSDVTELQKIKETIMRIKPDKIQLNSLDRPGTERNVQSAGRAELESIVTLWSLPQLEIISGQPGPRSEKKSLPGNRDSILKALWRRPCTLDDLVLMFTLPRQELISLLDQLQAEGTVRAVQQDRGIFFTCRHHEPVYNKTERDLP